jgi:hypothetical protein
MNPQRAQNLSIAVRRVQGSSGISASAVAGAIVVADLTYLTEERVDLLRRISLDTEEQDALRRAEVSLVNLNTFLIASFL